MTFPLLCCPQCIVAMFELQMESAQGGALIINISFYENSISALLTIASNLSLFDDLMNPRYLIQFQIQSICSNS